MLLTIYNLPLGTRYVEVKSMILANCGPTEVILDNLVQDRDNTSKKVTVGLAEEEDAAILVRKLNGLVIDGHRLIVETVKKKQVPNQNDMYKMTPSQLAQQSNYSGKPLPLMGLPTGPQQPALQQPYYQQTKYQPSHQLGFSSISQNGASSITPSPFSGLYGSQNTNYGYPQQFYQQSQQQMSQSMGGFDQRAPLGFSNQGSVPNVWSKQNDWNLAGSASGGNQVSQQSRGNTRWDSPDDRRSSRHDPPRDHGRDRARRSREREEHSRDKREQARRDYRREGPSHDRGRDAPRDSRRGASYRDRDRDVPARDRAPPARDQNRDRLRDEPFRRSEPSRAPNKRQYSPPRSQQSGRLTRSTGQQPSPQQQPSWNRPEPNKTKTESNYFPPSKRAKPGIGYVKQLDNQKADFQNKNNVAQMPKKPPAVPPVDINLQKTKQPSKNTPERMELRSATWRNQLTSLFAKGIVNDPQHTTDIEPGLLLTELKRAIRHRMEMLFAGDLKVRYDDMKEIYQQKFNDTEVFLEVVDHIKNHGRYVVDGAEQALPPQKRVTPANNKPPAPEVMKQEVEQPAQTAETVQTPSVTLPSYPHGDKQLNKVQKRNDIEMFEKEEQLLSRLDEATMVALNKEIDDMCTQIPDAFQDEPPPDYKRVHTAAKTTVVDDLKKILKVNFAKRKLNISPIMLRIFNNPKMINRSILAPILAEHGVTSLRKTEKKKKAMYIGTCDTYDVHDKLCSMPPIQVQESIVVIKPFQLIGSTKISKEELKARRNQIMQHLHDLVDEGNDEDINNDGDGQEDDEYQGDESEQNIDEKSNNINEGLGTTNPDDATNENAHLESKHDPQEDIGNDDVENVQSTETENLKTEIQEDDTQGGNIELTEVKNEPSIVKQENTELDTTPNQKPVENIGQISNILPVENEDFTADVDIDEQSVNNGEDSFRIDAEADLDADKDISDLNADDLEDFKTKINYDDIDMVDLNEDDLEDW